MQHCNTVLRAGWASLSSYLQEQAWWRPSSSNRMGLKPISAPLSCCWGSTVSPSCTAASQPDVLSSREMDTPARFTLLIQDLRYHCPARERWLCRLLGFSLLCMDLCNLLLSWIWRMSFYIGISELTSNPISIIDEIMTNIDGIVCRYMAMHKPQDLGALPSSSVQLSVSFTSWLNSN